MTKEEMCDKIVELLEIADPRTNYLFNSKFLKLKKKDLQGLLDSINNNIIKQLSLYLEK